MPAASVLHIRPAGPADLDFVLSLLPRLVAFGPPPWRDPAQMVAIDLKEVTQAVQQPAPGETVWLAETDRPVGFVHVTRYTDYYQQTHAHIANLVVAAEAAGQGVGKALLAYAEELARSQGYATLSLSVFAQNASARALYEKAGFGEDIIRYVKPLENESR